MSRLAAFLNRNRARAPGLIPGLLAATYVAACLLPGEPSDTERIAFRLDFPQPYRVLVAGSGEPTITIVADGRVLQTPGYRLESLDPAFVGVDASGRRLEGVGRGPASVRVVYQTALGTLDTVFPVQVVVSRVAVDSPSLAFTRLGARIRLSAVAFDANDLVVPNMAFTWSSADQSVATVNDTGLVTAVDEGVTAITAEADDLASSSNVTVAQMAAAVWLAPELDTLRTVGRSVQFIALALDSSGGLLRTARPHWTSSDTTVARVDPAGRTTATGAGTTRVIARVGTAADTATLVVAQVVRFVVVTPTFDTLTALADTARVVALGFDTLNFATPNPAVTWATSDPTTATVDPTGRVTAAANGVVLITASSGSQSAFATVVVRQKVATALIAQDSVALAGAGDTVRLSATGLDRNGFIVDRPVFTWRSLYTLVATVDSAGLATARFNGMTGIVATPELDGQSDTVTVSVTGAPLPGLIAFESGQNIDVIGEDGSGRTVLIADAAEPAWSPDGARLAFTRTRAIHVARADGSEVRSVTNPGTGFDSNPAWSPDGTKIAFSRWSTTTGQQRIHVVDVDGSNVRQLSPTGYYSLNPAWSPDGTKLAFEVWVEIGDGYIHVMNADGSGPITSLSPGLGAEPAWSANGSQLAFSDFTYPGAEIVLMNADGSGRTVLTRGVGRALNPAWSRDGAQIVFASQELGFNSQLGSNLYIINRDGSGLRLLTSSTGYEWNPAWR